MGDEAAGIREQEVLSARKTTEMHFRRSKKWAVSAKEKYAKSSTTAALANLTLSKIAEAQPQDDIETTYCWQMPWLIPVRDTFCGLLLALS